MVEITEKEIKEHLDNLINALYALSPSRNYVLQFLDLLPKDYPRMVEAYPHLFRNEETRDRLKEILGIRIGETVDLGGYGTVGNKLRELSNSVRSNLIGSSDLAEARKKLLTFRRITQVLNS